MSVRRRGKRWVADYRDNTGRKRLKTCARKADAEEWERQHRRRAKRGVSYPEPAVTFEVYSRRWLERHATRAQPRSLVRYRSTLEGHLIPALGALCVSDMTDYEIRELIERMMTQPSSLQGRHAKREKRISKPIGKATARHVLYVVSAVLKRAVKEGLVSANPCAGIAEDLGLKTRARVSTPKALDERQLSGFIAAADALEAEGRLSFEEGTALRLMAWCGLRMAEAGGLRWDAVYLEAGSVTICRQINITHTKGRKKRFVELPVRLVNRLRDVHGRHVREAFRRGHAPRWVTLPDLPEAPGVSDYERAHKRWSYAFALVLKRAALPGSFTLHSLRHTFASIHLSNGTPIAWVKEQLGQPSISMTVDTYGSWLKAKAPGAADRLADGAWDRQSGDSLATTAERSSVTR